MHFDLQTISAEIDATGGLDQGRRVAVKYITAKGEIRFMQISKRQKVKIGNSPKQKERKGPNMKRRALIPVIDHTDNDQAKDLFLFGIIGFNPAGAFSMFYPVKRGNEF